MKRDDDKGPPYWQVIAFLVAFSIFAPFLLGLLLAIFGPAK